MKRFWLIGFLSILWVGAGAQEIEPEILKDKLPDKAQEFIEKYFPGEDLSQVEIDPYAEEGTIYAVQLTQGFGLVFDEKGRWKRIDAAASGIPRAIVPGKIDQYIQSRYPNEQIGSIDNRAQFYAVRLSGGQELTFDRSGKFIGRDR